MGLTLYRLSWVPVELGECDTLEVVGSGDALAAVRVGDALAAVGDGCV